MSVTLLKEVILPAACSKNGFKLIECSLDSEYKGGDQFQSNVVFVTATVLEGSNKKDLPLVVKFEPFDKEIQRELRTAIQFHNEVLVYNDLLPLLNKYNKITQIFPKFYHGISTLTLPEDDVIVIEDLRPKGFQMAKQRVMLDYEHLKLAMEKLGIYHALSYITKHERPNEFYNLVKNLKETTWIDDGLVISPVIKHAFHRAMDPLIAADKHSAILQKVLSRVDESVVKFLLELVHPEEPLAVLCHGDFNRNNMLFKYNQDVPESVRFFDVATARYSSPSIDIAFLLFMNSTKEVRSAHWDDLLSVYHQSLTNNLGAIHGPSMQQLQEEMRLKGVYGYVHASFFLPMMLFESDFTMDDLLNLSPEEVAVKQAKIGGEEGTKMLMELVEELVSRGCLTLDHPFLMQ
ncbi:uncharacterized protein LOC129002587 [Macrosteles quadrilineatus]|uniref:uncharacterized protein LOC129002587 n=1 Tax=Macrosteles quadrilineatus TaxID=74068 RepID=UPI0023E0A208|nr:uncharacterized protein LOC129002587 [Macrosteles quadrilineatus]